MKNLPKLILLDYDKNKDLKIFVRFLNNQYHKQHRNMILRAFPELKELLEKEKNDEFAVRKLIENVYVKYSSEIKRIIEESKKLIKTNSEGAFRALGIAMEYQWGKDAVYTAIPTLLPFCPFENNKFYFSVLWQIKKGPNKDLLMIAIHEISHFIFFDYLKKVKNGEKILTNHNLKYFLQESLTTALFNTKPLKRFFKTENQLGNPEIRELYVQAKNNKPEKIADYIKEKYIKSKENKQTFENFITAIVAEFINKPTDFEEKRILWNKNGVSIFSEPTLLKEYQKPIRI